MATLNDFVMTTGYYDEGAILQAAGVAEREARFADIFGDAQGSHDIAAEYQALLDEARRLNTEMHSAAETAQTTKIAEAIESNNWHALIQLGAAVAVRDSDMVRYELTALGFRIASGRATGLYADQAEIDN
jgi:hypothetical protein